MVATPQAPSRVDNADVAAALERAADLLEVGRASAYRVRAYRSAADTVRSLDRPVAQLVADGPAALAELPTIGSRLAGAIAEITRRGTFGLLVRLQGETAPEDVLASVPGLGPTLAGRIHDALGVESLEELEIAAHDGRLERVPGIGPRRTAGIRETVGGILRRRGRRLAHARRKDPTATEPAPSERVLLDIDERYRRLSAAGRLRRIAPRRFNPDRRAWLPIFHTERDGWDFDVLFSNTARAHQLGKTKDWVVIYYARGGHERQCTVVTDRSGRRVVRGLGQEAHADGPQPPQTLRRRAAIPSPP